MDRNQIWLCVGTPDPVEGKLGWFSLSVCNKGAQCLPCNGWFGRFMEWDIQKSLISHNHEYIIIRLVTFTVVLQLLRAKSNCFKWENTQSGNLLYWIQYFLTLLTIDNGPFTGVASCRHNFAKLISKLILKKSLGVYWDFSIMIIPDFTECVYVGNFEGLSLWWVTTKTPSRWPAKS